MVSHQVVIGVVVGIVLVAHAISLITTNNNEDDRALLDRNGNVTTPEGTTYGTTAFDNVTKQASYRGIRYGQAPIGDLRFAPPVKFGYGDIFVNASQFGEMCIQGSPSAFQGAEDCLFLNVYVPPSLDPKVAPVNLPVAVWIYGGGFMTGSSNLYPADELTKYWSEQGSKKGIVVTLNYRLNVFGFLGSDTMRLRDSVGNTTGNAGIQDQRLALQWVQDNIASFSGNKNDVMIFGQSAGAASAVMHMTMKNSFGLYSHVLLQSGSFTQFGTLPLSYATSIFNQVVSQSSCTALLDASLVQCLSDLSAYDLFTASWKISSLNSMYNNGFGPVVDNVEIKTHPYKILEDRETNPITGFNAEWDLNTSVDILQGFTQDEGTMFLGAVPTSITSTIAFVSILNATIPQTSDQLAQLVELYVSDTARALYPQNDDYNDFWLGSTRAVGDLTFSCPARRTARALAPLLAANPTAQGGPKKIFNYFYEYASVGNAGLVPHAAELRHVFQDPTLSGKDKVMSDVLSTAWGNFLTTRDPNAGVAPLQGAAVWTQYAVADDNTYRIKNATAAVIDTADGLLMDSKLKEAECDFMDAQQSKEIELDFGEGTENGNIVRSAA